MTVRFLAEAETELDEAVAYYEAQSSGLGRVFALVVRDGVARIEDYPKAWQRIGPRVRRYLINRFPYAIVDADLPEENVIVAVMHLHRRPDYWRKRLDQV